MVLVLQPYSAMAQIHALRGKVRDASTDELLPFVTVYVKGLATGTSTDANGMYRLALKSGLYELLTSMVGYKSETRHVEMEDKDQVLDLKIFPTDILLQEVTVYSSAPDQASQPGVGDDGEVLTFPPDNTLVEETKRAFSP